MSRRRIAVFTATGCCACERAILDVQYEVGSLSRWAEVVFWPHVIESRWEDLHGPGSIDVCLFAGAIVTDADRRAALRLRDASRKVVAYGACAAFGGLPGLCNLASVAGDAGPGLSSKDAEPELPRTESHVKALGHLVAVDYVVPGCPPTQPLVWAALQSLICPGECLNKISFAASRLPDRIAVAVTSGVLPPTGSTFAGEKAVCASCSRIKEEKKFQSFQRPHQINPDSGRCLLEQGLVCQGLATREGCGGLCTAVGAACRGCFGKAEDALDPGAKMVSAISSTFDSTDAAEIARLSDAFVDLAGTFYRYTLPTQCILMSGQVEE